MKPCIFIGNADIYNNAMVIGFREYGAFALKVFTYIADIPEKVVPCN